ncbi:alpha/beta hydrolase [Flagellimonas sp. S174]|uniref:alpha/beta hydrolase n=1 Tax=Flagellimonas sp. S174 TaxID=3410790 RepID=UPI003BF4A720
MRKLGRVAILIFVLFLTLTLMLTLLQEKFIFLPTQLPENYTYSFERDFEEFFLTGQDEAKLNALHFKSEDPKGVILYFHGNAGDLSRWGQIANRFLRYDYDVIVMDYRGYGKSTGKRSESNLFEDAQLFYDYTHELYAKDEIIIYGRSLGCSIATHVASNNRIKKLILETPFYNLTDVAQDRFPFLPMKPILKYKLASNQFIQQVKAPIRIFHGTEDRVVAYDSGKRLFEVIPIEDKKMYTIEKGEHNNLSDFKQYWENIEAELAN